MSKGKQNTYNNKHQLFTKVNCFAYILAFNSMKCKRENHILSSIDFNSLKWWAENSKMWMMILILGKPTRWHILQGEILYVATLTVATCLGTKLTSQIPCDYNFPSSVPSNMYELSTSDLKRLRSAVFSISDFKILESSAHTQWDILRMGLKSKHEFHLCFTYML